MGAWTKAAVWLVALFALPAVALADIGDRDDMGWGYHMTGMGGVFGFVMMLVMIAVVVILVIVVWRTVAPSGSSGERKSDARSILDERYARGEIDRQEYEERRKVLGS